MARSVRLRSWQKQALDRLLVHDRPDFLAVATPGSGKTTLALTAARHHLVDFPHARLVVVVPTQHLKQQWATAALAFDLHLEPDWSAAVGHLPADMHGIITTYQQVAGCARLLTALAAEAFVVFDEVHHAGDERAWGEGIAEAFAPAARRLSLSGTPFRSDTQAIPFVTYDYEEAQPDFEYGYGEALADGRVVRPVHFPRIDGHMEWTAPDGSFQSHAFNDDLDAARANQRLRTALSLEGQWLPAVVARAHSHLTELRKSHLEAGGLVIAMDQEHARGIADLLEHRHGARAVVATSDDPMASRRIARFAAGSEPWIVAVRMVSEGVDIPRLRVGVYATNTQTELFFRQAIGRLVRYTRGLGPQPAYLYLPDDPRLCSKAAQVTQLRRHSLHKRPTEHDPLPGTEDAASADAPDRVSQFSVISAVALDEIELEDTIASGHSDQRDKDDDDDDESLIVELAPAPRLTNSRPPTTITRAQHKSELRALNVERVRELVALTGMSHAAVNKELNARAGISKVTEATLTQLERRLRNADVWLTRLITPDKRKQRSGQ